MGVVVKSQYRWFLAALLSVLVGLLWMRPMGHPFQGASDQGLLFPLGGVLLDAQPTIVELAATSSEPLLLLTVRLRYPDRLGSADRLPVQVFESDRPLLSKYLHRGDPDLFLILKPDAGSPRLLTVGQPGERTVPFEVALEGASQEASSEVVVEAEPNNRPEEATPFTLGATVFASADDRPFVSAPGQDPEEARAAGVDWYTFWLEGSQQRLVFISLDVLDREVPLDVTLFQSQDGRPVPYTEDLEPLEPQPSTRFAGQKKFLAGRLIPGQYFLRVHANHPAYQLRTQTYPVPPHHPELMGGLEPAAQQALRAAMDYLILKGDSWHANTPRSGAVDDRLRNLHPETAQCSSCHAAHFSTRSQLVGAVNGYPVRQRNSLEFLAQRLYSSSRPLYGHPGAAWFPTTGSSAGALSRLSVILNLFEKQVSLSQRQQPHRSVAEFLKLYYKGRTELPPDESGQNQPIISAFEAATHSWSLFDELHRRTGESEYAWWSGEIRKLIDSAPQERISDLGDLCDQTIAFATINPEFYQPRIQENVDRIFSYQRPDGQWPMGLEEGDPPAEFQTGHCLYTLALAGVPKTDPRVRRALFYLLSRQRYFGGWLDDDDREHPHPYESFQTSFRETQWAIMALSQYFPGSGGKGWQAGFDPVLKELDRESWTTRLGQMDQAWTRPDDPVLQQIASELTHPNALIRHQAAICLGRVGETAAVDPLVNALRDPSKLVRRPAAYALRQLGDRGLGQDRVAQALMSSSPWTRRGAVQVFAQHHHSWSDRQDARDALIAAMGDSDPWVRLLSARALWQWWYWDSSESGRSRIEDVFLKRLEVEPDAWVEVNLKEGLYNLLDENVGSLYSDWIPSLGEELDRQQAISEHAASTLRQAGKLAAALQIGSPTVVSKLLEAVGGFHLRRHSPGRYESIGNDVETIHFDGGAALALKPVFRQLLVSPDVGVRRRAFQAAYTLRGSGSGDVLGLPFLRALQDPDPQVRRAAQEFHREFIPRPDVFTEPAIVQTLESLIQEGSADAQIEALGILPSLKLSPTAGQSFAKVVKATILRGNSSQLRVALRAIPGLPALWRDLAVVRRIGAELGSQEWERQRAALRAVLQVDALSTLDTIQERLEQVFLDLEPGQRGALLQEALTESKLAKNARLAGLVAQALREGDGEAQNLALKLVSRNTSLQANAAVRTSLRGLFRNGHYRIRQQAKSLHSAHRLRTRGGNPEALSLKFFETKVQPIFFLPGPDGKACVQCHHNHGVLKLTAPEEDVTPSEELTLQNYQSALRVVDVEKPESSLILVKPVSTALGESVANPEQVCHGGDLRWPEREQSRHYQTILAWIRGAHSDAAAGD